MISDRLFGGPGRLRKVWCQLDELSLALTYDRKSVLNMGTQNIRCLGCNTFHGKTGLTKNRLVISKRWCKWAHDFLDAG